MIVIAVHLAALEGPDVSEQEKKLREQWAKDVEDSAVAAQVVNPPRLAFLSAPFRRIHAPLLKLINDLESGPMAVTWLTYSPDFAQ